MLTLRCATFALLACLVGTPTFADDVSRPPNIIYIMADDMGYGGPGCYGQELVATPNIDRIAERGVLFTQFYAGAHVCQPSRCVLMTGLHTGHTAVRANNQDQMLLAEDVTIAELLHDAGYATGGFGKWGLGFEGTTGHPNRQGFDEWVGQYLQVHAHFYYPYFIMHNEERLMLPENEGHQQERYVADVTHEHAMSFIREHADGPFFAYLPYIIPHVELVVPAESEEPYRGQFPVIPIQDPRAGYLGSEDGLTTYAGMIDRFDGYIGEVLELLEELDIEEETLVIFTSDNGGQNGGQEAGWTRMTDYFHNNANLRGYKGSYYEGGLRVPFIVSWPGHIEPGRTSDHIGGFQDVFPTLCDVAGLETPEGLDGISFWPTLHGSGQQIEHDGMYWEYPTRNGISRAARIEEWKAVQNGPDAAVELYNLDEDISETTNIAADHPDIVAQLVEFMDGQHVDVRDYPSLDLRFGVDDFVR